MYHFIVNPASRSGKGKKIWKLLEPVLLQRKIPYHVVFSKHAGHITHYVRALTSEQSEAENSQPVRLVILGGDGTLNEAVQGISQFEKVELGYIPTGSSNDMARDLQLPKNPLDILDRILSGLFHRYVDIGSVSFANTADSEKTHQGDTRRYFAVSSGIGFDAAVCEEALSSRLKSALNQVGLGKLVYLAIALKQMMMAGRSACNLYPDQEEPIHYKKFLFAASMIHQYEGGGFQFCPGANAADGLLDVCVVGGLPKFLFLLALPAAFAGKHYLFPGIDHYRCSTLTLETSDYLWVHTDGEVTQRSKKITITCHKEKLHLLV